MSRSGAAIVTALLLGMAGIPLAELFCRGPLNLFGRLFNRRIGCKLRKRSLGILYRAESLTGLVSWYSPEMLIIKHR